MIAAMLMLSTLFLAGIWVIKTLIKRGYDAGKGRLCKRTSKGRELNLKLEGLKEYLKDYSLLDEREVKEIELWEDYLIYSVMFGQNKNIVEEFDKYMDIQKKI